MLRSREEYVERYTRIVLGASGADTEQLIRKAAEIETGRRLQPKAFILRKLEEALATDEPEAFLDVLDVFVAVEGLPGAPLEQGLRPYQDAFRRAWELTSCDKYREALDLASDLRRRYPERVELAWIVGLCFYYLEEYEEAIDPLSRYAEARPHAVSASIALFQCLLEEGKTYSALKEAERFFSEGCRRDSPSCVVYQGLASDLLERAIEASMSSDTRHRLASMRRVLDAPRNQDEN